MLEPTVSIVIPSRDRPDSLLRSARAFLNTTPGHAVEVIAVLDRPDERSQELLALALPSVRQVVVGGEYLGRPQDKYNLGYRAAQGAWIVTGADDIVMDQPGWLDACLALDRGRCGCIGLNDKVHNAFATLFMEHRRFIDGVMGGYLGLPWYHVWFADMEVTARAQRAGLYHFCPSAAFTHYHPANGTAASDPIYQLAGGWYSEDDLTYQRRSKAGWPEEPGL